MALFHRQFDVVGIVVATANDNQVFETTGNEQLSVLQKSQVSRAQKWTLSSIRQIASKSALGLLRFLPVSLGDARARYPDLSYLIGQAWSQGLWINNDDLLIWHRPAAAHKRPRASILIAAVSHDDLILLKWRHLKLANDRYGYFLPTGNNEGSLGQSITREKGLSPETVGCKGFCKALQCFFANWLGSVKGDLPTTQIESCFLLRSNLTNA